MTTEDRKVMLDIFIQIGIAKQIRKEMDTAIKNGFNLINNGLKN